MSCRCPLPDLPAADDDGVALPSAEALLAGTMALMTGVIERAALAQPLAAHGQSLMMSAKVRVNLLRLTEHPHLSAPFRATLARLQAHWERLALPGGVPETAPAPEPDRRLWHRSPERVQ